MAKKYPGLYLYFDWLRSLEKLPPAVAMEIVCNLYHYAEERREPIPLTEPLYAIIQDFLLDQLKRSIRNSESNKRAAERCNSPQPLTTEEAASMTDEELLEHFRTNPYYADEDPEELLATQRMLAGGRRQSVRGEAFM